MASGPKCVADSLAGSATRRPGSVQQKVVGHKVGLWGKTLTMDLSAVAGAICPSQSEQGALPIGPGPVRTARVPTCTITDSLSRPRAVFSVPGRMEQDHEPCLWLTAEACAHLATTRPNPRWAMASLASGERTAALLSDTQVDNRPGWPRACRLEMKLAAGATRDLRPGRRATQDCSCRSIARGACD